MILYIDPGTGSMLFSVAVGLISVIWFAVRKLYLAIKYRIGGKVDTNKKDIVIYGEDKRYWTAFKGILDEFEKRKVKISYLAGSEDDPVLNEDYKYVDTEVIGLGNKAYAKLNFLNARIVLSTTPGLDVFQWKRSKAVDYYVHMTHAISGAISYQMFGTQFYDSVLMTSDIFMDANRELEEKRNSKPKEILAVGCTYMDHLLARKEKFMAEYKTDSRSTTSILVAPTWGSNGLLSRYGSSFIHALIDTGFDITIRPHPQSFISDTELINSLMEEFPESGTFHWNKDSDMFEVLSKADLMISDFSGIIYDYTFIFERPVLYTELNMDLSQTDDVWLDEPYYGKVLIPRLGKELKDGTFGELKSIITEMISDTRYHDSIISARDEYWQHQGEAASLVTDYLMEKLNTIKTT